MGFEPKRLSDVGDVDEGAVRDCWLMNVTPLPVLDVEKAVALPLAVRRMAVAARVLASLVMVSVNRTETEGREERGAGENKVCVAFRVELKLSRLQKIKVLTSLHAMHRDDRDF